MMAVFHNFGENPTVTPKKPLMKFTNFLVLDVHSTTLLNETSSTSGAYANYGESILPL